MTTVSATYAKAFLEAADKQGKTALLLPLVGGLAPVFSDAKMIEQLADPRGGPKARLALVEGISSKMKLPELLANLLRLLAAHKRLGEVGSVLAGIIHLANARANITEVKVESASPMTAAQVEALKAVLKKQFKASDVLVSEVAAPGLIGGFRAFANGSVWDCSIKGRLNALAARFTHAIEK